MRSIPPKSVQSSGSVLRYIYLLIALTITVCTSIAGALILRSARIHQIERTATDYHLLSLVDISRIEFDVQALEQNFYKGISRNGDTLKVDGRGIERAVSNIGRHTKSILATQDRFAEADFQKPIDRLVATIEQLESLVAVDGPEAKPRAVLAQLNLIRTRCVQLNQLHAIAFREKQAQLRTLSSWTSFVVWMSILLGVGCLSILSVLGFARRAIKRRERAEHALAHRAMQAELLHSAVSVASQADTVEESLRKCIDIVCAMTTWPAGHAYVPSKTQPQRLEATEISHGLEREESESISKETPVRSVDKGEGLPGRVWETGEPEWITDLENDPFYSIIARGHRRSFKAAFAIPIKAEGETFAVLEFFNDQRTDEDRTLMLMVRAVGEQVGLIVARKMAETRLRDMDSQLAHVGRLKTMGEMVAGIAHEINQPLAAIANYSLASKNVLESSSADHELPVVDWIQRINQQAVRCGEIIRNLRNYVKKEDDQWTWVDLNRAVNDSIALITSDLGKHGVVIECNLPNPGPKVRGIEVQIQQVIVNLLRNACDATGELPEPRVEVKIESADGRARLVVFDNGPGIDESMQARLFDPFFTTKADGMGMGLAICKTIIDAHEGKLRYARPGPVGSAFIVELPAVASMSEEEQIVA